MTIILSLVGIVVSLVWLDKLVKYKQVEQRNKIITAQRIAFYVAPINHEDWWNGSIK